MLGLGFIFTLILTKDGDLFHSFFYLFWTVVMKIKKIASTLLVSVLGATAYAQVAYDNADLYPGNPDHGWPSFNGGFGYNAWTPLADTGGGGTFMEGVGVNGRQVEGSFSFALYAGGGSFDISRQLASPLASGQFNIITRFDIAGAGPNLVNLRAGNSLSSFSGGELLSFGLVNGNQLSYTDGAGFHQLASGEARGSVWNWNVVFNAASGAFSLSVTNLGGGYAGTSSGTLEASGTSVGSFAVINSSTGGNQNVIFDTPTFLAPVPEPTTLAIAGLGLAAVLISRRSR
jgi:hypothetical protein